MAKYNKLTEAQEQLREARLRLNKATKEIKVLKEKVQSLGGNWSRPDLRQRNESIYRLFEKGASTKELSESYSLSVGRIRTIVGIGKVRSRTKKGGTEYNRQPRSKVYAD